MKIKVGKIVVDSDLIMILIVCELQLYLSENSCKCCINFNFSVQFQENMRNLKLYKSRSGKIKEQIIFYLQFKKLLNTLSIFLVVIYYIYDLIVIGLYVRGIGCYYYSEIEVTVDLIFGSSFYMFCNLLRVEKYMCFRLYLYFT